MAKIDLKDNEFFDKFVGPDHVDSNDVQFWYQLLSCSFNFTRVNDHKTVDRTLSPFIDLLALNNSQSYNFGSLIRVALDRVSRVKSKGNQSTNPYYVFQSFNALYLIKTICKNFIENSSEEMLLQAFRAKADTAPQTDKQKHATHLVPPQHLQKTQDLNSAPAVVPTQVNQEPSSVPDDTKLEAIQDNSATISQTTESQDLRAISSSKSEPNPKKDDVTSGATMLDQFISTLIEIVVDIPLNDSTYLLQVEAINSLLVLLSIQMYSNNRASQFYIFRTLMHKKCSIHALILTKTLLNNFIRQDKTPQENGSIILGLASGLWRVLTLGYGQDEENQANMSCLARQSLLLLNVLTNHCTTSQNPYREAIIHCQDLRFNPSDPIMAQHIADNDALATASTSQSILAANNIKIPFSDLFSTICTHLENDQVALLLYLLLHSNKIFKPYILTTESTNLDQLLLPLLKILYSSIQKGSHHIYMVLIIFVILSEESSFSDSINKITLKNISWFKDRTINEISLGSFTALIVIRSFQYNTFRVKDKFLHTNLFATMGNLSNHVKNLHPYVCQRLVDLLERLTKRYLSMTKPKSQISIAARSSLEMFDMNNPLAKALATETQKQEFTQDSSAIELNSPSNTAENHLSTPHQQNGEHLSQAINISIPDSQLHRQGEVIQNSSSMLPPVDIHGRQLLMDNGNYHNGGQRSPGNSSQQSEHVNISMDDTKMDLDWIEEIIRMLLEVINNLLDSQIQCNPDLVYTLLYKRHVFSSLLSSNPTFYNMVINVERILTFFYNKIESYQRQLAVEEIKELIVSSSKDWISSQAPRDANCQLLFRYVEDDQPEDFFIPYMWNKIYYSSSIAWNPKRIVLFNPEIV